ncbi:MAG: hypothetical protein AABW79_04395 [Nanoarchaeota archaeon]
MMTKNILFGVLVSFLLVSSVSAFGVTTPYWDENPLQLSSGQTHEFNFELQNFVGSQDYIVKASLFKNEGIATLIDPQETYSVPLGTKDTKIPIRVKIPDDAIPGQKYTIGISFTTITTDQPGSFGLGSAVETYVPVQVVAETPSASSFNVSSNLVYIGVAIVIVLFVFFVWKRRKSNS